MLDYLNPFSENFILWDIIDGIKAIVEFVGGFFEALVEFFIHIFVPTDSQWEAIKSDYEDLYLSFSNHIPFWSFIQSTFTEAENTDILSNDFLIIEVPEFEVFGVTISSSKHIEILELYEPYRIQIRGLLLLVVYACAFVYIIKLITDYKANVDGSCGADNLKAGNRLHD